MSDNTADMDKVIERIQKLLSRTKGDAGTSEAEAETAMRLAQDLMMKHNLDMAVIEAAADKGSTAVERVKEESKSRVRYKWQRDLAKYVAEANFCYHLIKEERTWSESRYVPCDKDHDHEDSYECELRDGSWQRWVDERRVIRFQHIFVGRKANVITAQMMFAYLTTTIEELVPVARTQDRFSRAANSWKTGCTDRLCERLAKKRQDLIAENDIRIKQEDEERKAAAQAAHDAKNKNKPKELPANEGAEIDSAISGLKSRARVGHSADIDESVIEDRPEVDETDEFNPADAVESPPEEAGTSMVLASVYDANEQEANYEVAHNLPLGSLANRRRADEERMAESAKKEAEEAAIETQEEIEAPVKEETERQRQARLRREEKENESNRRYWAREDSKAATKQRNEFAKRDPDAYRAGAAAGKNIGLDLQVKGRKDQKKLTEGK